MDKLYNVSSGPHVRSKLTTRNVMLDVIIALLPATIVGIWANGFRALLIVLASVATAVLSEFIFDFIAGKPNTTEDLSAVLTGLLLALCLPATLPVYYPILGSAFAILVVKSFFGGLGHNFMNPALTARCFLLISFSGIMTNYAVDGVSGATPLVDLAAGKSVDLMTVFFGFSNGVIGSSAAALLVGGIYLLVVGGITYEIPAATLVVFTLFVGLFGGHGFDISYLLANLFGGGIIMGAFFMATDPVTSPVSSKGQLIFGAVVGLISGIFRVYGSAADSVSYAIIISNMFTPLIDDISVPVPYGNRVKKEGGAKKIPRSAVILCVITLIAGAMLSGVYTMTKDTIDAQKMAANLESYKAVLSTAESFEADDDISAAIAELGGDVYGTDFGKAHINDMFVGKDASGNVVGYVISASSDEGFDGTITLSLGLDAEGTITGLAFTELHETAGMGMRCDEDAFKSQFTGIQADSIILNKSGGASADNEINSVSGASVSSGAVVNAINAALDFFAANAK